MEAADNGLIAPTRSLLNRLQSENQHFRFEKAVGSRSQIAWIKLAYESRWRAPTYGAVTLKSGPLQWHFPCENSFILRGKSNGN
jgi:hypothetical protein